MAIETWRQAGQEEREEFNEWIIDEMVKRHAKGLAKYHPRAEGYPMFKGDPIKQLQEELLDALFYVWYEGRYRASLEEKK